MSDTSSSTMTNHDLSSTVEKAVQVQTQTCRMNSVQYDEFIKQWLTVCGSCSTCSGLSAACVNSQTTKQATAKQQLAGCGVLWCHGVVMVQLDVHSSTCGWNCAVRTPE